MVEDSQGGPTPDSPWPRVEISWEEQQAKPYGDRGARVLLSRYWVNQSLTKSWSNVCVLYGSCDLSSI